MTTRDAEHTIGTHMITIDIETIPDQREGAAQAARSRIAAPGNYKDPDKIAAYIEERGEKAYRDTALDGSYGEIICIGYAIGHEPAEAIYRDSLDPGSEKNLIEGFWDMVDSQIVAMPRWIGQRVASFDLRFLWRRSVILDVPPSRVLPMDAPPWSREIADVSYMWTGDRGRGIKLETLAEVLGIEGCKDDMDGSQVWDAFLAGRIDEIVDYCVSDVEVARKAFYRMSFLDPTDSSTYTERPHAV